MANPVIVVDVDITVVQTDQEWLDWLNRVCRVDIRLEEGYLYPYDITELFSEHLPSDINPYDFWRDRSLYHPFEPIEGSVQALESLHEAGWDVVFASHCKDRHMHSKVSFLKRNFPFMKAFLATKEKGYVRADAVVDDRVKFLNQFDSSVTKFLLNTPYAQCERPKDTIYRVDSWDEIKNKLIGEG